MEHFDVVIVGGGSSGSALAGRLTEDVSRTVCLLEAGPDYSLGDDFPEEFRDLRSRAAAQPGHPNNWSFTGSLTDELTYRLPRGKVIGGCSSINGGYFIRGTRHDFDRWEQLGNPLWSYDNVLPFYRRAESDQDFDGEFHGSAGPVPVARELNGRDHPVTNAFFEAILSMGYPEELDKNAPSPIGVGLVPHNAHDGVRVNAAMSYLVPNRKRPNLEVRGGNFVRRVLFTSGRASGVEVEVDGTITEIFGDEIVLCAGAVKSAHTLLLSGIGAADELRAQGVEVVCELTGVGKGFMDHPHTAVGYLPFHDYPVPTTGIFSHAAFSFTTEGSPYIGDIEVIPRVTAKPELHTPVNGETSLAEGLRNETGKGGLSFGIGLQQPESRGEIRLVSADPHIQPQINYHYMREESDLRRMREGIRLAAALLETAAFRDIAAERTKPNSALLGFDRDLNVWIRAQISTATHTSRSCHMGPESDESAVVDQTCRVRGVDGLRVVDTSVMPFITSRGPSATAVMIGERASAFF